MRAGDVIETVAGRAVLGQTDWFLARAHFERNQPTEIQVRRGDEHLHFWFTITKPNWTTWNRGVVAFQVARAVVLLLALVLAFKRPDELSVRLAALMFAMIAVAEAFPSAGWAAALHHLPAILSLPIALATVSWLLITVPWFSLCAVFPRSLFTRRWPWALVLAPAAIFLPLMVLSAVAVIYRPPALAMPTPFLDTSEIRFIGGIWGVIPSLFVNPWPFYLPARQVWLLELWVAISMSVLVAGYVILVLASFRVRDQPERRRLRVSATGLVIVWVVGVHNVFVRHWGAGLGERAPALLSATGLVAEAIAFSVVALMLAYTLINHRTSRSDDERKRWLEDRVRLRAHDVGDPTFIELLEAEKRLFKNEMVKDGKFAPVRVSIDANAASAMADLRRTFGRNRTSLSDQKNTFWNSVRANAGAKLFSNKEAGNSLPHVSIAIASVVERRFASLLDRIREIEDVRGSLDVEVVIVIADPSMLSDEMLASVKSVSNEVSYPIQVLSSNDNTISKNRNLASAFSRGQYRIFLDDDVQLVGSVLQSLIEALEQNDDIGYVSAPSYDTSRRFRKPFGISLKWWRTESLAITNIVAGMITATRSDIVRTTPFSELLGNAGDDIHFLRDVHLLGFLGAYVFPQEAYVIDESVRLQRASTGRNALPHLMIEEALIVVEDSDRYDKDQLELAAKKFEYVTRERGAEPPWDFQDVRDFWIRLCVALRAFLDEDNRKIQFSVKNTGWEGQHRHEIEKGLQAIESKKSDLEIRARLARSMPRTVRPSLGMLKYEFGDHQDGGA